MIQLLDSAMNESFKNNEGAKRVNYFDAIAALKRHCESLLGLYSDIEKEYLNSLALACKRRSTYRFKFPNNAPVLYKYMTKSQEFNLVRVVDAGSGRRGTTYAFDYSYCILQDIPTHYISGTEKINKLLTLNEGEWISRITTINEEIIAQSEIPGKIEGIISYLVNDKGFIKGDDGTEYFFSKTVYYRQRHQ